MHVFPNSGLPIVGNRTHDLNGYETSDQTDEQLLEAYLGLPKKQRDERFVSTARAAKLIGLSQRTVQLWIEFGTIQAVTIGRKYIVDLQSVRRQLTPQMHRRL